MRDPIRTQWWSLGVTAIVMVALAITVPVLYYSVLALVDGNENFDLWIRDSYVLSVGLAGLVLIFCLVLAMRQRDAMKARDALERERFELEDVRTRLSEVSALFAVSASINLQLRLDVILEIIVRRVVSTLRAQQASIMLYDVASGLLETRASYGLESEFARQARRRLGEGIAGWVAEHKEAVLLGPKAPNESLGQHYKADRNITSALSLPLRVGDRCIGVLNVNRINHPEPFKEHHRDVLRLFSEHVGSVIERAETLQRLSLRTQELERSNLQLSELNRMKDVFLSTASHELKTPLTSVIAYAEILDESEGRLEPSRQREFVRRVRSEAQSLLQLIDDILDLSRLETGKLQLQVARSSLNDVAQTALETSRPMADKHGVRLVESLDSELVDVSLDPVKMRQVLINLLTNAIKFSPEDGLIEMRTRRDGAFLVAEVTDQGPGIHPDDLTNIFELFGQGVRTPPKATRQDGLGIGLHLVKRITELHGGHVGVNSLPGEGSTFWVRIPVAASQEVELAA